MAGLTWADDDGFDAGGRRMASVMRVVDILPDGAVQGEGAPGFFRWDRYWEAYVHRGDEFELVLVDGAPGRWRQRDEAREAAESAYQTVAAWPTDGSGDRGRRGRGPVDGEPRQVTGPFAHLRSLVRAWRKVHRSGPDGPIA